jgi:thiol-disulfide isomerase/thioredoxin
MRLLVSIFNHRTYPLSVLVLILGLIVLLALNGLTVLDVGIVVACIVLAYALWRLLVTSPTPRMDSLQAVEEQIRSTDRPTIIEFYSAYCVGCMAMKPVVDRLEMEADHRVQIIRLNISEEPGKTLMARHDVVFTPTFLTFNPEGRLIHQSVGLLDRTRLLQEIEGQV